MTLVPGLCPTTAVVEGMTLPPILHAAHTGEAIEALRAYFRADPAPAFSGSRFERLAGGGDRPETAHRFTADDLVAVTMLGVDIPAHAALRILGDHDPDYQRELCTLLQRLPTDLPLVDAREEHLADAEALWALVRDNRGVGRTRTSKLLARKRPHLLPVIDSVVVAAVGHVPRRHNFYRNLRAVLRADDRRLAGHLAELQEASGIGDDIGILRIFDVLVWMWGTGNRQSAATTAR